jgi:hypothetical protein
MKTRRRAVAVVAALMAAFLMLFASEGSAEATPYVHAPKISVNIAIIVLGKPFILTGVGFFAKEKVTIAIAGHTIATVTADELGDFSDTITLPSNSTLFIGTDVLIATGSLGDVCSTIIVVVGVNLTGLSLVNARGALPPGVTSTGRNTAVLGSIAVISILGGSFLLFGAGTGVLLSTRRRSRHRA